MHVLEYCDSRRTLPMDKVGKMLLRMNVLQCTCKICDDFRALRLSRFQL